MNSRNSALFALLVFFSISTHAQQVQCFFSSSTLFGCPPLVVNFQDLSTGSPTSHSWDFDNGNTSTTQNPTATFINGGIYNVKHVVSNGTSTDSCFLQIRVFIPAAPDFTAGNRYGCIQPCHNVGFTNLTIPGESPVLQYIWDFGDGALPQQGYNVNHCFANTGAFNITLVTLDSNGCQSSVIKNNYVVIGNYPTLNAISANPTQSCTSPQVVNFTSNASSTNGPLSYNWNFDGAGSSTLANPTQVMFNGLYDVVLTISDTLNCQRSDTVQVSITDVDAGFFAATQNACNSISVQFNDTSNFASSWLWDFGDGTTSTLQNPTHTYTTNGSYNVSLTVSYNGCNDTETQSAYINVSTPVSASFTADDTSSCTAPLSVNFTGNAPGAASYNWVFGDGGVSTNMSPTYTYNSTGSFTVTFNAVNAAGCVTAVTRPGYIDVGTLSATISADSTNGCTPLLVNFSSNVTSNSPITSYLWDFGDGTSSVLANPLHYYNTTGQYVPSLDVTNAEGCIVSVIFPGQINVGQSLSPAFSALPLIQCVNQTVTFTNQTSGSNAQTIWLWEFGDGQTSAAPSPTHAYSDTGTYTVTLTVINQGCSSDTEIVDYILIVVPKADFNFEFDCNNPTTVQFRDTSQGADSWFWDFGDGTTSNLQNPLHTFPSPASYDVTLIVENFTTGCIDSIKKMLPIGTPDALFFADTTQGCRSLTVQFSDSSTFASGWFWDFGDGTAGSSVQSPTHTFTDTGRYTITLVINPGQTCSDTVRRINYITVYGVYANFFPNPTVACVPMNTVFTDSSKSYLGSITSWKYYFGTGDSSSLKNPTYTYNNSGNFNVSLRVTDSRGCSSTATKNVAPQSVTAGFTSDTVVCPGETTRFFSSTQSGVTFIWDFGDGTTGTGPTPTHTYGSVGNYSVTQIIILNNIGCRDTIFVPNLVDVDTPVADFYVTTNFSPCPPFPVQFYNTTNRFDLNWIWVFGDGDTSTSRDPLHVYFFPGDYDVKLVAWDSSGCADSITYIDLIRVRGPIGNFEAVPDSGCVPLTTSIVGSVASTVNIIADLGDGTSFNDTVNLTHTYTMPGTYYPIYTLTDSVGCVVSYPVDTIVVGLIPYPGLPTDTTVCKGNYVPFNLPYGDYFVWTANQSPNYLSCDSCKNTLSTAPDTIVYYVTATTNIGCVASDTITVNVDPLPPIQPGPFYRICPGDTLQLTAGAGVNNAFWTPNIFINDTTIVNPLVFPPDTQFYRVTGYNQTGCSISKLVRVYVIKNVDADLLISDSLVCEGGEIVLDVNVYEASVLDTSFLWIPSTYLDADNIEDPTVSAPFGSYTYTVIVSSTNCVPDTDNVNITIAPIPSVEAGDDQTVTDGTVVQIYASSPNDVTYSWLPSTNNLSCVDCRRPFVTAQTTETYYVAATNQWGCFDVDSVTVRVVKCDPSMVFVPNSFTPNGDGLNDVLYVRGIGLRKLEYFRVFDRWGQMVYQTQNINEGWDGVFNGKAADIATYVYTAKGECSSGNTVEVSGNVTLVR
ncbi:MAG: PKD domain-containing protein [Bacteroidetes bacterium]|nr:PKD domain-containing protein [Bacteroidota bacterium]